ncbi:MAG: S1 family peptidase [Leptolyngbyaceae cyanobacterium]
MKLRKTYVACLSLGAVAASVLMGTLLGRTDVAQGCSNFWVNPESGAQECLDGLSAPGSSSPASASPGVDSSRSTQTNWMRDYVRERRIAQALATSPELTRAELEAAMTPMIIGGARAGAADNRFQVGLLNKNVSDNFNAQFCGGTLYKGKYVITAAHCVDFVTASQLQVLTYSAPIPAARLLTGGTGVRRNVSSIAIHPGWTPATSDYDVAVLTLTASVPGGGSVGSLAQSDPAVGTGLLVTGWGSIVGDPSAPSYPNDLRKVTVPLFNRVDCNDADSYGLYGNEYAEVVATIPSHYGASPDGTTGSIWC